MAEPLESGALLAQESAPREQTDARVNWMCQRIRSHFRWMKLDKLLRFVESDACVSKALEFLDVPDVRCFMVTETSGALRATVEPLPQSRQRVLFFLKLAEAELTLEALPASVLVSECRGDALVHLQQLALNVFMPVVATSQAQHGWTELVAKEVQDAMHSFIASLQITVGHTKGDTCLPLPPDVDALGTSTSEQKDRMHVLEGCLITWTKQIKKVLRQDPEMFLKQGSHPGPLLELSFWENKAANLNSIFNQLQSDRVRKVLRALDQNKSTYNAPFAKLCKEVFHARAEANDNAKFLAPLRGWFSRLESSTDYEELELVFRPMLHLLLLVWKGSRFYNTPARLVVLMREVCNALIRQSSRYISGEELFTLIDNDEARRAVQMIRTTLRVCGAFKSTYFDYKAKANSEMPQNPWRIQNNALFSRLDAFLERCHDILDLTQTIMQFSKLGRIEIGGTKGKVLTTSVSQIHADFQAAVERFRSVSYGIMDVDAKQFDDDFFEFRAKTKELERRLASVLTQGFDDCATVTGRFKLLDSFEDLLERPIIKDELEKKHLQLLSSYGEDLVAVNQLFHEHRHEPPIPHNLPPIAGSLHWCRGLLERVKHPMQKLAQLNKAILEREEATEVVKTYTALVSSLTEYEHRRIEEWGSKIEASSQAKLKLPLLTRDPAMGMLRVNFDPALVRLLREVKYFLLLGLDVPALALTIFKKAEVYRRQTGNLDLIVDMHNNIQSSLLPVERPLVQSHLEKIERTLAPGLKSLNWKSHGIEFFLTEAMATVREASDVLATMKHNLARVEELLRDWASEPLLVRKSKPVTPKQFQEQFDTRRKARMEVIAAGGKEIHKLMKDTVRKLKVSAGLPDWKAYVDFVSSIVVAGLSKVVQVSLVELNRQLDPQVIRKEDKLPLLEIELDLRGKEVRFIPSVHSNSSGAGVRDVVNAWIDSFFHVAKAFKRLDTPASGSYVKDMQQDPDVTALVATITENMTAAEVLCADFLQRYTRFTYLWTTDLPAMFAEFLQLAEQEVAGDSEDGDARPRKVILQLELFNERIRHFRDVQHEIAEMKTPTDLNYLRVNSQPIKQALSTWVTKWVYTFTQHLHDHVLHKLQALHEFMLRVNEGLLVEVAPEDQASLMKVMAHIRDVRKCMDEVQRGFGPLRDTVALLQSHGIALEGALVANEDIAVFLENAPVRWDATVHRAFKKKEEIQPLQNQMADAVKADIARFHEKVRRVRAEYQKGAPFDFAGPPDEAYSCLDRFHVQIAAVEREADGFKELEDLFELTPSRFPALRDSRREMQFLKLLWDMASCVSCLFEAWRRTLWADIKTEDLLEETAQLLRQGLPREVREWETYRRTEQLVRNMSTVLPLIAELHSPAMRDRHWKSLMQVTMKHFEKGPSFCLDDVLQLGLHEHVDDVMGIVEVANKELKIDQKLSALEQVWGCLAFKFTPYKDMRDMVVLDSPDQVVDYLEDHQLQLQNMAGMGKFVKFFEQRVHRWQDTLSTVESTLRVWLTVQRQWCSLETIFTTSADIRKQLPEDTKRFEGIDRDFKELMRDASTAATVVQACTRGSRWETLHGLVHGLELCQKSLNEYLDLKKSIFPRFFFCSNSALLDILSNGNNPPRVMPHFGDCFDGMRELELAESQERDPEGRPLPPNVGMAMVSKDGERVALQAPFHIRGAVENWLNDAVRVMRDTLARVLAAALEAAANWEVDLPRDQWVFQFPAQIALLASQVTWTDETERALDAFENDGQEDAVKQYQDLCTARLEALIRLVQGELSAADRNKVISLITIDVHSRDVVQQLVEKKTAGPAQFLWQSQLRYYWDQRRDKCSVKITDFVGQYSYEYIGNSSRLVITPLTDRCYITLAMALRLMLGGAPAGPAGTGKTETTKDLAKGMGLPCYVFNCSDQMNYQTMGDIFKGLAQTGAWGCFDEFNRINVEVLSVVATQVKCILDAIRRLSVPENRPTQYQAQPAGTPPVVVGTFDFLGSDLRLVPTVGLFITMNPGYAGRTELPENLKALFRSCAMIRPDLEPICENMLMAEGFVNARPLAVKFVTLYTLAKELLSQQVHYDWGLRAVKSVLRVAGMLKRADAELPEDAVLMRALRDFNVPKIVVEDMPVFLRLVSDLFPGLDPPRKVNDSLRRRCVQVCQDRNLVSDDEFTTRVEQLLELLQVRHSVMVLGPAGAGKTTIWKTLAGCLNLDAPKPTCVFEVVNPKAVTADELYGTMTLSKDWRDGVLSIIMRSMSRNHPPYNDHQEHKWVALDGDIDAEWIESMNTVMDDNKVLTLVSNERIPLSESMRLLFETHSLQNASPATVSRAGILYVNENDIGWSPFVESWIAQRPDKQRTWLPNLFVKYIRETLAMLKTEQLGMIVPLPVVSHVQTLCYLLEALLEALPTEATAEALESLFVYSCIWAFGGALAIAKGIDFRDRFSTCWRSMFKTVRFPDQGTVFDHVYDASKGEMVPWATRVPDQLAVVSSESSLGHVFVPTVDTVRLSYMLELLVQARKPVMLVGSAGTGKTALVREFLRASLEEDTHTCTINMNYYTDALALQCQMEQPLDRRSGKVFGPTASQYLIYVIDDLNMPFVEKYGTQTPIALLRQYVDHRSWFDREDLGFKKVIADTQLLACMNPTAGSFTINPRLQRHFVTFAVHMPDLVTLRAVYGAVLQSHLSAFSAPLQALAGPLTDATIELHKTVREKFLPSAVKFHYNFNMRELNAVVQGMCRARSEYYRHPMHLLRLWLHECYRVFADRLVQASELGRFEKIVVDVSKKYFEDGQEELHAKPLAFGAFVSSALADDAAYLPVKSGEEGQAHLQHLLRSKLAEYNDTHSIMNLVLFDQAIEHVVRIARIVGLPNGNALLVGVGGSGKQSLTRLAAFICGFTVIQLNVSSSFSVAEFKESLREMYRKSGVKPASPLVFLLTDGQIVDERFLIYINDLLSSGYIPELFAPDEYDAMFSALRPAAKAAGVSESRDSMLQFFLSRVRANLHVVLCMSPVGEQFRTRARKFPGIINCTCIDWFQPWPKDALVSVSWALMAGDRVADELRDNLAHHMAEVHLSVTAASERLYASQKRHNYATPKSFLELVSCFNKMFKRKAAETASKMQRLEVGVTTLRRTADSVEQLQQELTATLHKVEDRKRATEALLEDMGRQRGEAEKQQAIVDHEREKAARAAAGAAEIEAQAEQELAAAKPILDAAREAVNCLDKGSLSELKSMAKPPPGVDKVTTCVLMMLKNEKRNFSWDNAKKMMAKVDAFKKALEDYRAEDMHIDTVRRVEPICTERDFDPVAMQSKSVAAANLSLWVTNTIEYHNVYVKVKPLMEALEVARGEKEEAEGNLAKVEAVVRQVNERLAALQKRFLEATNEKAKVEAEAAACQERLSLAERLVRGLSDEYRRWKEEIETLREQKDSLPGDCMLGAAFVSYVGAFDAEYREQLWRRTWVPDIESRDIPIRAVPQPLTIITTDACIAEWMNEGLPADNISVENGAILTSSERWPLLIDPQLQGIKWLKRHLEARGRQLVVMQASRDGWIKTLRHAVSDGAAVIIENISEELDASLEPLLARAVSKKSKQLYVRLGAEEVEYDPSFQLFLQTRRANPHFKPEIQAQCTLVNFTVTERGLEDQLLAEVVSREQPDLEMKKKQLQEAFNRYKIQLLELENQMLERVANAPEDILSDVPLIEGLEATKAMVLEINEAVRSGQEAADLTNLAREVYRPVAAEGALLYFLLIQLCNIDHMYQYSLDSFTTVFFKAMAKAEASDQAEARVRALVDSVRFTIFTWVSRGLFQSHKLIFLAQLTFSLMRKSAVGLDSGFSEAGLAFLLRAPLSMDIPNGTDWLPDTTWYMVQALSSLPDFDRLPVDIIESPARFKDWYSHMAPETEKLPMSWRELEKEPFRKLLVLRCLRPDRMTVALTNFIRGVLPNGPRYTECDAELTSYEVVEHAFSDSTPDTPIYFILSPGADIVAHVDRLAQKHGMEKGVTYHNISLGQGQDVVAMTKLEARCAATKSGHWVLLNNVHLMPRWLHQLQKRLEDHKEAGTHPKFRLFLSSDPSDAIPIGILERCIKLTDEPPSGLKNNAKRALGCFSKAEVEEMDPPTRGILFGLCHFHTVMLERKKFGPIGFNMVYPFSAQDLLASAIVLRNYMENAPAKVPWEDLRYIFGAILYGGHIVNDSDRLLCATYLDYFLRDELFEEMEMFPFSEPGAGHVSYRAPPPATFSLDKLFEYVDASLEESPLAFGLHPNAEVGFRTEASNAVFHAILELQPAESAAGEGAPSRQHVAESVLQDVLEMYRDFAFDVSDIKDSCVDSGPFQSVFIQECEAMNMLVSTIVRSLAELEMGFRGDLTMTDDMALLETALYFERVPDKWAAVAWSSLRPLASWLADLQARIQQLNEIVAQACEPPRVTWLSGLFNPQSFLTAIMQQTAQRQNLELDKLGVVTEVTKKLAVEEVDVPAKEGAYVTGLVLEGARWDVAGGMLDRAKPREMFYRMPIILFKAAPSDKVPKDGVYICPMYKTAQRGPTLVSFCQLRTKAPPARWVMAGVALILDMGE